MIIIVKVTNLGKLHISATREMIVLENQLPVILTTRILVILSMVVKDLVQ
jgi:hypothetical protein